MKAKSVRAWAILHLPSGSLWPGESMVDDIAVFANRAAARKFKKKTWLSEIIRVEIRPLPAKKGKR